MRKFYAQPESVDTVRNATRIGKKLPKFDQYVKRELKFLLKNIKKCQALLDVGCGEARHLAILANKASHLVGVDINETAIENGRKRLAKEGLAHIDLIHGDAETLTAAENYFDYVICMLNTFGNFGKHQLPILNQMKRVLKPDGKIFISVYTYQALGTQLKLYPLLGYTIDKYNDNYVWATMPTGQKMKSERFTKMKLLELFEKADLNSDIKKLCKIAYISTLTKRKEAHVQKKKG